MTIAEAKALLLPLFKMGYVNNIVSFKADGESFVCYHYTCPFDKVGSMLLPATWTTGKNSVDTSTATAATTISIETVLNKVLLNFFL